MAQEFKGPQCFYPRGSAIKYDPKASDATNAAVASKEYIQTVKDNVNQLKKENGNLGDTISTALVTTSLSGFDPDLTPEAANA
ncbi:potassium-transporting ATPase subunit C [Bacillus sp. ISL-7]|uniref:potassium-transporting ATPase subunit C n=1 Tax=Bacillus sp. ISL-7 TaxID=2819136 RepID=UPI001BEB7978|nr:potassium-transporting ATPase subunit C [Bacillus sp. ISL-7]MBT2737849.1 potassium-transporting ATPase subunit C [Bacillus sp. ISL-7]